MPVRVDKYLWEVRLFKSRSLATEACRKGKVLVSRKAVKPAFLLNIGDGIDIRKGPVVYSFKVINIPTGRVGAKSVGLYLLDVTAKEQLDLLALINQNNGYRAKGSGRPTKKERRDLTDFVEDAYMNDDFLEESM